MARQGYKWNSDGTAITFTLRDGVKWSDGQPFSADDVAYTFQLMQNNKALNYSGLPITGVDHVRQLGDGHVLVGRVHEHLPASPARPGSCRSTSGAQQSDPATWTDPTPIGTGPYVMDKFTAQGFTLKANPTYWGGAPKVAKRELPGVRVQHGRR